MTDSLPANHKALVQEVYAKPLVVKSIPTPRPTPGSAVIEILHAPIISYTRDVYNGKRKYPYPTPLVTGASAIGRVAATGPDATLLKEGDLVYFDCTIRGRDDSSAIILAGIAESGTEGSRILFHGEWRDGTFAEYAKVPLENVFVLDEKRLCGKPADGGLGYQLEQMSWLLQVLVPYGGLKSIGLQAGETVIVAPATGGFGSAAVVIALAMGARVIAMGRSAEKLADLKALSSRVETVQMTGELGSDVAALKKFGKINAFLDISPAEAEGSTHFKAAILSLAPEGRVSLMGGLLNDVAIPHRFVMRFDITLRGKWMYSRADILSLIDMMTAGVLNFRDIVNIRGTYNLEDWEKALELAANSGKLGELVVFSP
ncbi:alcohol dehydrogenase [Microthyrium microscopicum]|uniref:Alcohol dehydrogenase n=1 Tax=Microthyrium microscopicum TaxID=703497 RepID=A0A6A6U9D1_9PEZI|nr:alcohol dehydrogenase [Microthyrium microscopicum]